MTECSHTHLFDEAVATLRTAGLRITEQRRSILRVLAKADGTLSAEETFEALDPETCDVVTVYRCLESFERAGAVQELSVWIKSSMQICPHGPVSWSMT